MKNIMQISNRPPVYVSTESKDHISEYFSGMSGVLDRLEDYHKLLFEKGEDVLMRQPPEIDLTLRFIDYITEKEWVLTRSRFQTVKDYFNIICKQGSLRGGLLLSSKRREKVEIRVAVMKRYFLLEGHPGNSHLDFGFILDSFDPLSKDLMIRLFLVSPYMSDIMKMITSYLILNIPKQLGKFIEDIDMDEFIQNLEIENTSLKLQLLHSILNTGRGSKEMEKELFKCKKSRSLYLEFISKIPKKVSFKEIYRFYKDLP